jgi:hypothetical protein
MPDICFVRLRSIRMSAGTIPLAIAETPRNTATAPSGSQTSSTRMRNTVTPLT